MKYTVLKYNFEVLYLSLSMFYYFILILHNIYYNIINVYYTFRFLSVHCRLLVTSYQSDVGVVGTSSEWILHQSLFYQQSDRKK